jgi:ABC-2 type transport system permease protein
MALSSDKKSTILSTLSFFKSLLATSIKASISTRGAFLTESGLMLLNNLVFFYLWFLFFRQFNNIGGWNFDDMVALMAIGTGAYGLMRICFGGINRLSRTIIDGDLDPFMTQPKNLLIHVISSRSFARGWGHLLTTVMLVYFGGLTDPWTLFLVILGVLCGSLVFASAGILAHSLAFWLGPIESLADRYFDSLFLFALYPTNIYSGLLEIVMFTLIPAGIIGFLPVELIRNFSWEKLGILIGSCLCFVFLAFFVFAQGLKRYESGNQFGIRM